MNKLSLNFVTPLREVAVAELDSITAPSALGEVTILPMHRPLLADLQPGVVVLNTLDSKQVYAISGGFLEVGQDKVTILAETCEAKDEIDLKRAKAALADAEKKLDRLDATAAEWAEEKARVRRAQIRIQVSEA
ncbi:ATP synthase F1 subunit epsilon [Myxococcota bacterium]|nr:ATP synthase F1 subunit epsilon [Myxococcota bacterium]